MRLEALFLFQLRKRRIVLGIDKAPEGLEFDSEETPEGGDGSAASESDARNDVLFKGTILQIVYKNAVKALPTSLALRLRLTEALKPFHRTLIDGVAKDLVQGLWQDATSPETQVTPIEQAWEERVRYELQESLKNGTEEDEAMEAALDRLDNALEEVPTKQMAHVVVSFIVAQLSNFASDEKAPRTKRRKGQVSKQELLETKLENLLERSEPALGESTVALIASAKSSSESTVQRCFEKFPGSPEICQLMLSFASSTEEAHNLLSRTSDALLDVEDADESLWDQVLGLYSWYLDQCIGDEAMKPLEVVSAFMDAIKWFYVNAKSKNSGASNRCVGRLCSSLLKWIASANDSKLLDRVFARLASSSIPPVLPLDAFLTMIELRQGSTEATRDLFTKAALAHPTSTDLWVRFIKFEREHGDLQSERRVMLRASKQVPDTDSFLDLVSA